MGLQYLRARWYHPGTGRLLSADAFPGLSAFPITQQPYLYAADNPLRYTDPSGYIAQDQAPAAEKLVNRIAGSYGIYVRKDWATTPPPMSPSPDTYVGFCGWYPGIWTLAELELVDYALTRLSGAMGGEQAFRAALGGWRLAKTPRACGRGCVIPVLRKIDLMDRGLPPVGHTDMTDLIVNGDVNFDAWTMIHELGHAWDANHGWGLSEGLEMFTGGYTTWHLREILPFDDLGQRISRSIWFWQVYCGGEDKKPGCNVAGYFYGGIPPKGSDANFNRKEDFAESVAAYVFPAEAQRWVTNYYVGTPLWYADYRDTMRWQYINELISGTGPVP